LVFTPDFGKKMLERWKNTHNTEMDTEKDQERENSFSVIAIEKSGLIFGIAS
jgi:hypothetical protein